MFGLIAKTKNKKLYIDKNEMSIPIWSSLLMKYEELLARVDDISKKISIDHKIFDSESLIGGGTMPDKKLLTPAIGISSKNIDEDLRILSNQEIPLIPRISEDKIINDEQMELMEIFVEYLDETEIRIPEFLYFYGGTYKKDGKDKDKKEE